MKLGCRRSRSFAGWLGSRRVHLAVVANAALATAGCDRDPVEVTIPDEMSNQGDVAMTTGLVTDDMPSSAIDMACLTQTTRAEARQVSMYMMLDSSASMLESDGTLRTKWESVTRAIEGFLAEIRDSDLQVGFQFFPLAKPGSRFNCSVESDCGPDSDGDGISDGGPCFLKRCNAGDDIELCASSSDCPGGGLSNLCLPFGLCSRSNLRVPVACDLVPGEQVVCDDNLGVCADFDRPCTNATRCDDAGYASPAVEIGTVSGNLPIVSLALEGKTPQGPTPTGPALRGALDHARAWGAAHPDQTVVVLLATDGLPTQCGKDLTLGGLGTPEAIENVVDIASSGLSGDIPVRTFVIGVFQQGDTTGIENMNQIANAGGTDRAVFIDSSGEVDEEFLDALRAIRSGQLGCEFQIPASSAQLDYFEVNLQVRDGTRAQQLPFVRDRAGCDANGSGWHYDVDPNQNKPSSIQVCPNTCSRIKAAASASIELQLGCATIVR